MVKQGMTSPIIPQTWLRDPAFLLRTSKSQEGMTGPEQTTAIHRLLGLIEQTAQAEQVDLKTDTALVTRKISDSDRKRVYLTTKKFVQGMAAGEPEHGYSHQSFLSRFASGEFDTVLWATTSPTVTGKYWPWVKAAQTEAKEAAAKEAAAALATAAAEAEVAAETAKHEAEEVLQRSAVAKSAAERAHHLAGLGVLAKLQVAYRRTVEIFSRTEGAALAEAWPQAEEKVAMRQERVQKDVDSLIPLLLMPLKRKDSFCDIDFDTVITSGWPQVVFVRFVFPRPVVGGPVGSGSSADRRDRPRSPGGQC